MLKVTYGYVARRGAPHVWLRLKPVGETPRRKKRGSGADGRTVPTRWWRGVAARQMVHDTKGRVIAVDEADKHVVASVCFDRDDGHIVAVMTEKVCCQPQVKI